MVIRRLWLLPLAVLPLATWACTQTEGAGSASLPDFGGGVPFGIDARPVPASADLDVLTPPTVGSFSRVEVQGDPLTESSIYVTYRSPRGEVFMEAGFAGDLITAQAGVEVALGDVIGGDPAAADYASLGTDPAYFLVADGDVVFMAWGHGAYYFSVDPHGSVEVLVEFMNSFPY